MDFKNSLSELRIGERDDKLDLERHEDGLHHCGALMLDAATGKVTQHGVEVVQKYAAGFQHAIDVLDEAIERFRVRLKNAEAEDWVEMIDYSRECIEKYETMRQRKVDGRDACLRVLMST